MEFDSEYGTNYNRLESWQNLCTEVGIERLSSITQCKKVRKSHSTEDGQSLVLTPGFLFYRHYQKST